MIFEWSGTTMKDRDLEDPGDIRPEYDFAGGIRGKYADQFPRGVTLALIDPDVAEAFPTSQAINDALRSALTSRQLGYRERRGT